MRNLVEISILNGINSVLGYLKEVQVTTIELLFPYLIVVTIFCLFYSLITKDFRLKITALNENLND